MRDLEAEGLIGHEELEDGGALPLLRWKIPQLHIFLRVGVLIVQPNILDGAALRNCFWTRWIHFSTLAARRVKVTLKVVHCSLKKYK
jgi:hypothetical protein